MERPGGRQSHRLRLVRPLRADRRTRQVRLPLPRRRAAAARTGRKDLRLGRRGPSRHLHGARRPGGRHRAPRADRHDQLHLQRALRGGPPVRLAGPPVRGPGRLERGHLLGRLHRRELPARRIPAARGALLPREGVPGHRDRAVRLLGRHRDPRRPRFGHLPAGRAGRGLRPPGAALRHRGPLRRAPQPAGPPGDLPGGRLRRGPRVRRLLRRRDLRPVRDARRGPGVLRRRQGPAGRVRPPPRRAEDPARRHLRPRRHRRRGARARPRGAPPPGQRTDRDQVPGARLEPGPVRLRPGRPAARHRSRDRREHRRARAGERPPVPRPARDRPAVARARRGQEPLDPGAGHRHHLRPDLRGLRGHCRRADRHAGAGGRGRRLHPGPPHHPGRPGRLRRHRRPAAPGAGVFRTEYAGTTLRDHLGLAVPGAASDGRAAAS